MVNILLEHKELVDIAKRLKLTNHGKQRIEEFYSKKLTLKDIRQIIITSPLAWKQSNQQYVILVDEFSYFVLYKYFENFMLVSYLRKSKNNYTPIDKFILEYKGVKKKCITKTKE